MKVNIILDGNFFSIRSLFANRKTHEGKLLSTDNEREVLKRKNYIDFSSSIRAWKDLKPKSIVYCADDRSWRKGYLESLHAHLFQEMDRRKVEGLSTEEIEKELLTKLYKANRVKDESRVDWDAFFRIKDDFEKSLPQWGITLSKGSSFEGDDQIAMWVDYFRSKGESSIIIASDGDLKQLLFHNSDSNNWAVMYNPMSQSKVIYTTNETSEYLKNNPCGTDDWWDLAYDDVWNIPEIFTRIAGKEKAKLIEVDPVPFILEKVIKGDPKDNISSPIKGVGPSFISKMYDALDPNRHLSLNDISNDDSFIQPIIKFLEKNGKTKNIPLDEVESFLRTNIKLLILNKNSIPSELVKDWESHIEEPCNWNPLILDYKKWFDKLGISNETKKIASKGIGNIESLIKELDK